ncbi:MAG: hypothetical protein ACFFC9_10095 [Promethearchaeota archaeon]
MHDLTPEEEKEVFYLEGTKHDLFKLLRDSICECPICTHQDKDIVC